MNLNAAALRLMASKGLTLEDVAEIVAANEKGCDNTNAQRQARYRENKKAKRNAVTVTPVTPPNDIDNLTPREVSEPIGSSPQRPWALPAGVSLQVWEDFKSNRKRKKLGNTPTAWKQFNDDLIRVSAQTGIPPPQLIEQCTAKGWGAIYDPRKQRNGQLPANVTSLRGHRPDPALDLLRAASAAEDREDRGGVGPSLPAIGSG